MIRFRTDYRVPHRNVSPFEILEYALRHAVGFLAKQHTNMFGSLLSQMLEHDVCSCRTTIEVSVDTCCTAERDHANTSGAKPFSYLISLTGV